MAETTSDGLSLTSAPLHQLLTAQAICYERNWIESHLAQRAPFLFLDRIVSIDRVQRTLLAECLIAGDNPVFTGHFPGDPVLPGVLQIEAMGQACLCLWAMTEDGPQTRSAVRLSSVDGAKFYQPILPDQLLEIQAAVLFSDDLLVKVAGQIYVDQRLCAVMRGTLVIVDE